MSIPTAVLSDTSEFPVLGVLEIAVLKLHDHIQDKLSMRRAGNCDVAVAFLDLRQRAQCRARAADAVVAVRVAACDRACHQ